MDLASWDATGVVARAKALIHASNYEKVADARKEVDDTLSRWVAAAQTMSDPANVAKGSTAVVALWRQYAALEMELRQFKQATKVFERAVSCPVAGSSTALWLQYADFCVQRKKFSNARKIFVRALKTLPEREHPPIWQRFYAFVCTHVDNKLTLEMLQQQVMPEKFPQGANASIPAASAAPDGTIAAATPDSSSTATASIGSVPTPVAPAASAAVTAPQAIPSSLQPQQGTVNGANGAAVSLVDPVVAFIDKTGEVNPAPTHAASPLAVESVGRAVAGATKRGPTDPRLSRDAKRQKQDNPSTIVPGSVQPANAATSEPTAFFSHIPETLPLIATCSHLLFDSVGDGEAQKQIGNELLERLSDVLGDSAVFEGVRDLRDNQRARDREMLYRWQELVGMQMKEGSELFARHVALEMQHGFSDPRGLIALKTQHLEQRREFSNRCQMSQQQFIDVFAMDRANALKAQQISLENMKIPELAVTTDSEAISLQRAIVGLILEAEKLWREENQPKPSEASSTSKKAAGPSSTDSSRPSQRQRRDSQDSTTSSRSTARSSSGGGRQDPRGNRNWSGNGNNRRRDRDPRGNPRGDPRGNNVRGDPQGDPRDRSKWDIQPQQGGPPQAAVALPRYDYPPGQQAAPRLQEQQPMPMYDRGPQRMQPPLQQQQPRQFQQQQPYGVQNAPPYNDYGGQQGPPMQEQQGYAQPAYYDGQRRRDGDRFVGQGGPSRAGGWPQQQQPQQAQYQQQPQQPMRPHSGPPPGAAAYDPSLSRYGSGPGPASGARDGPGPSPYGNSNAPYYQEPPQQQMPYRQPQQQQQPPPRENYNAYAYGPPPGDFQQQRGGGRPMGGSRGPGGYGPGPQQQQQRFSGRDHLLPSPAPANNNKGYGGGGRNRRGGRYRR